MLSLPETGDYLPGLWHCTWCSGYGQFTQRVTRYPPAVRGMTAHKNTELNSLWKLEIRRADHLPFATSLQSGFLSAVSQDRCRQFTVWISVSNFTGLMTFLLKAVYSLDFCQQFHRTDTGSLQSRFLSANSQGR
jgi:hypothetical protein